MPEDPKIRLEVVLRVRKMFDLDCDPLLIARSFERIPLLTRLCRRFPGLRLPRGWDPFETAVCSILGQLVSASQRASLIGQLVSNYGEQVVDPVSVEKIHLFPSRSLVEIRSKRGQDNDRAPRGDSRIQQAGAERSYFARRCAKPCSL